MQCLRVCAKKCTIRGSPIRHRQSSTNPSLSQTKKHIKRKRKNDCRHCLEKYQTLSHYRIAAARFCRMLGGSSSAVERASSAGILLRRRKDADPDLLQRAGIGRPTGSTELRLSSRPDDKNDDSDVGGVLWRGEWLGFVFDGRLRREIRRPEICRPSRRFADLRLRAGPCRSGVQQADRSRTFVAVIIGRTLFGLARRTIGYRIWHTRKHTHTIDERRRTKAVYYANYPVLPISSSVLLMFRCITRSIAYGSIGHSSPLPPSAVPHSRTHMRDDIILGIRR